MSAVLGQRLLSLLTVPPVMTVMLRWRFIGLRRLTAVMMATLGWRLGRLLTATPVVMANRVGALGRSGRFGGRGVMSMMVGLGYANGVEHHRQGQGGQKGRSEDHRGVQTLIARARGRLGRTAHSIPRAPAPANPR